MPERDRRAEDRGDNALQSWKAEFFKALAHPARIRIVESLREGEKYRRGELWMRSASEQSNGSQHLSVLRNREIVTSRRDGTTILYSVRDPLIFDVLDLLRRYFQDHLSEVRSLLDAMSPSPHPEDFTSPS